MMNVSALQFSESDSKSFPFGISPKAAADALRELGAKLESGEICLESVRVANIAQNNAYGKTSVRLLFIEKLKESGVAIARNDNESS